MARKKLTKRQQETMNAIMEWDFKEQFIDAQVEDDQKWHSMRIAVPPQDDRVFKNLMSVLEKDWKIAKKLVSQESLGQFNIYNVDVLVEEWEKIYSA